MFGPISDFGSVVVNGVTFDVTNATLTIEGDAAEETDLRLGMVVFVVGTVDRDTMTGVAERVASDHLLEGPVDGVNVADGTFSALSQLVITDATTVFDQVTIDTLVAGDNVEVFGLFDADNSIRATRVEKKSMIEEIEVTGTISGLDEAQGTFMIGLLTVDFSGALQENVPETGLANGLLIEAEAAVDDPPVDDRMVAVSIEVVDPELMAEAGDGVEIEGFVTQIVSSDEFVMNGAQRVMITPETRFEDGTADDLVLNARVEVEGDFDGNGVVVAEEIEFESPPGS